MKKTVLLLGAALLIALSGCGNSVKQVGGYSASTGLISEEAPQGLKEAVNPTFKVGTQAIINANHMEGMNGAIATIVGAYDTTAYSVSFTPTTGGKRITDHKWIIQEEIKDPKKSSYKPGEKVVLEANHMEGMKGATATIDSVEHTTVYLINYNPTTGGAPVKNHKWVIGSELSAK